MTPRTQSIHARLLSVSKAHGEDFNLVLTRYALERWLYRLSVSDAAADFVLKGALLFSLWFNQTSRPTRDADFLGLGAPDQTTLRARLQAVCGVLCDDGMVYDAESAAVSEIRNEALYSGLHAEVLATLGSARSVVRVDVGFGDAVTPAPQQEDYPTLLPDMPRPRLHVYPREMVVAEKLEAIITLGVRNSRLKDYFDCGSFSWKGPWTMAYSVARSRPLAHVARRASLRRRLSD